jgi:hypothetical protein
MSTRKSIEIIPGSKGEFMYTYITSDNNYIYHSNYKTNSVVCYDFNGVKKWCYSSDLLKDPPYLTSIILTLKVYRVNTDCNVKF